MTLKDKIAQAQVWWYECDVSIVIVYITSVILHCVFLGIITALCIMNLYWLFSLPFVFIVVYSLLEVGKASQLIEKGKEIDQYRIDWFREYVAETHKVDKLKRNIQYFHKNKNLTIL